jgi:oligopeptide/dipeptide ABC transporter ATP-binding protein
MTSPHPPQPSETPLLDVRNLVKEFDLSPGIVERVMRRQRILRAVDGVSFALKEQSTLGLVGESGCGKSTTARLLTRLIPATSGEIFFRGREILSLSQRAFKPFRKSMQIVFQDPFSSLNPRKRIADIVGRPLAVHMGMRGADLIDGVTDLLEAVGLKSDHLYRYPHEFSGGQRQRIAIARALAPEPELLIADEPVSALDVSVQGQVLNLLLRLKEERQFSMIFISHNLSVVEYVSDEVAVMYAGKIVEQGPAEDIFNQPLHPYTQVLLAANPEPNPRAEIPPVEIRGEPMTPINPPPGCRFASRCPMVGQECRETTPPLEEKRPEHWAACFKVNAYHEVQRLAST